MSTDAPPTTVAVLLSRCRFLIELLRRSGDFRHTCSVVDYAYADPRIKGMTRIDDDSHEECLYVDESSSMVVRCTWETSGHNGDSYGHQFTSLDPVAGLCALQGTYSLLFNRSVELEARLIKEAERLRQRNEAVQSLLAKMEDR